MNRNEIRITAEACEDNYRGSREGPARQHGGYLRSDPCNYNFSGLDYCTLLTLASAATKANYRMIYGTSQGGWKEIEDQIEFWVSQRDKVSRAMKNATEECENLRGLTLRLFGEKIKPLQEKLDAKRREQVEMYYIALSADNELETRGRRRSDIEGGKLIKGDDPVHLSDHYYR